MSCIRAEMEQASMRTPGLALRPLIKTNTRWCACLSLARNSIGSVVIKLSSSPMEYKYHIWLNLLPN